ncbi:MULTISPECIES: hypothetical protein [unclassified Anaeromyxobacter]|uniref:hypothetical protein n=1 Tax=unclassified Anaeromyxobacter TaxID=2620896 RepID=UPI001F57684A|nr:MULTISPECIES: hypothetical protein [unclassified Anaeromyxobacter]
MMAYKIVSRPVPANLRPKKAPYVRQPGWRFLRITDCVQQDTLLSIGDRYLVVALHRGTWLAGSRASEPLTLELALRLCALLAFVVDSPVLPTHPEGAPGWLGATNAKYFKRTMRRVLRGELTGYLQALAGVAETIGDMFVRSPYDLILDTPPEAFLPMPTQEKTWRGLTAYWSGLMSVAFPGRILNFWRAMEAVTAKDERYALFENLARAKVAPLWGVDRFALDEGRWVNATAGLRREALRQQKRLISIHTSARSALDALYWQRRGPAAHADRVALEYDHLLDLGEQARDSLLLQYMARAALQASWS